MDEQDENCACGCGQEHNHYVYRMYRGFPVWFALGKVGDLDSHAVEWEKNHLNGTYLGDATLGNHNAVP